MAASELGCRKALVGTGYAISLLLCTNGNSLQDLGPPFLAMKFFLGLYRLSLAESCDY